MVCGHHCRTLDKYTLKAEATAAAVHTAIKQYVMMQKIKTFYHQQRTDTV